MRTELLKYIIEIDNCQSLSKAAENLFISRPSLSESLSLFEKDLNILLFERNKKGVTTTEAGKQIIIQAKEVLKLINNIYQIGRDYHPLNQATEVLTFGLSEKFAKTSLNTVINLTLEKFPNVSFNAVDIHFNDSIEALHNNTISFAIISFPDDAKNLALKRFAQQKIVLYSFRK